MKRLTENILYFLLLILCLGFVNLSASAISVNGEEPSHSMELEYAEQFSVDYYPDGSKLLTLGDSRQQFLLVPEGAEIPSPHPLVLPLTLDKNFHSLPLIFLPS